MFGSFRRNSRPDPVASLYGAIVTQARDPAFFRDVGVPDTFEGRFEMMILHVFLLLHRLKNEPDPNRELGQSVFDLFFLDMDRGLREIGVGDTKVPKKIRQMGEAFYGRTKAYDEALEASDGAALMEALARNILARTDVGAPGLSAYVRAAVADLAAQPFTTFARGTIVFPSAPRSP